MPTYNITSELLFKRYDYITVVRLTIELFMMCSGISETDWSNFTTHSAKTEKEEIPMHGTKAWLYFDDGNYQLFLGDDPLVNGIKTSADVTCAESYDSCLKHILNMCEQLEPEEEL